MTNLSGTEISKLTAMVTGGGYKRANSKDAAIKRLGNALAEKLGQDAASQIAESALSEPNSDAARQVIAEAINPRTPSVEIGAANAADRMVETNKKVASARAERETPKKSRGKFAEIEAKAHEGVIPEPPDFSAPSHARYRDRLAELVSLAKAGDADGLKKIEIKTYSSSPKAMDRYRNLAVIAIEAKANAEQARSNP